MASKHPRGAYVLRNFFTLRAIARRRAAERRTGR